ncbi:hypothetical protein [Nocardia goodfellowii]|uniref:Lipoprotein n=1 Tax=Nocardia goodfellowii TaxID=882446 RepID=A0ABS4QA43_9NOCA|nr:hypothetical protein [Nocardia goodfellowii]MBP2188556.1 hypothetical protein [Nocardia goodfellowii]
MDSRWPVRIGAALLALGVLAGCGSDQGSEKTSTGKLTPAVSTTTLSPEQERNVRIHKRLLELGCDTNSCIQTYFACMDGQLTGEACEFYRRNPLN